MKEQNNGIVVVDGTLRELPILNAWVNSSSVYWVRAEFPCSELYVCIGNDKKDGWSARVRASLNKSYGMFKAYVPFHAFSKHCETVYRIVSVDDKGFRHVQGEGKLRVKVGKVYDVNDYAQKCVAFFEEDEKWRNVQIQMDESGNRTYIVEQEPTRIEDIPVQLYAYDPHRVEFFKVEGVFDENGKATLSVSNTPERDGFDSFVFDSTTGFCRRMEAVRDEAGGNALVAGEVTVG